MYSDQEVADEELKAYLPKPVGYKLLIAVAKVQEKIGSIRLPDQYTTLEQTAVIVGNVINVGKDAYADAEKFPNGPLCQAGDWIIFRSYSGTRFKIGEQEFRLINDDQVEAVVDDPTKIKRAF